MADHKNVNRTIRSGQCVRTCDVRVYAFPIGRHSLVMCNVSLSHTSTSSLLSGRRRNAQECAKIKIDSIGSSSGRELQIQREIARERETVTARTDIGAGLNFLENRRATTEEAEKKRIHNAGNRSSRISIVTVSRRAVNVCESHARRETVNAHFREEKKPIQTPNNKNLNWFALTPERKCTFGLVCERVNLDIAHSK